MIKELTEKWKSGELEDEYYYVKLPNGEVIIESLYNLNVIAKCNDGEDIEILAPVPSYEEYLESESHCAVYSEENKRLKQELEDSRKYQAIQNDDIARLKELLKECKEIIEWYKADSGYVDLPTEKLLKQIEELDKEKHKDDEIGLD